MTGTALSSTTAGIAPLLSQEIDPYAVVTFRVRVGQTEQVAAVSKLSPDQTYRLLQRLTESSFLTRHGTKKRAWYERRV